MFKEDKDDDDFMRDFSSFRSTRTTPKYTGGFQAFEEEEKKSGKAKKIVIGVLITMGWICILMFVYFSVTVLNQRKLDADLHTKQVDLIRDELDKNSDLNLDNVTIELTKEERTKLVNYQKELKKLEKQNEQNSNKEK